MSFEIGGHIPMAHLMVAPGPKNVVEFQLGSKPVPHRSKIHRIVHESEGVFDVSFLLVILSSLHEASVTAKVD